MILANILIWLSLIPHEYHVGFYTLDFKENSCQITMKLFSDDFEKAFYKNGIDKKFTDDLTEVELSGAIQKYLHSHFKLIVNTQNKKLQYVGAEWDEDYHAIYFYWETDIEFSNEIEVTIENSIFLEVSNEQQNMHHLKLSGKEYTLLLDHKKRKSTIEIN